MNNLCTVKNYVKIIEDKSALLEISRMIKISYEYGYLLTEDKIIAGILEGIFDIFVSLYLSGYRQVVS